MREPGQRGGVAAEHLLDEPAPVDGQVEGPPRPHVVQRHALGAQLTMPASTRMASTRTSLACSRQ